MLLCDFNINNLFVRYKFGRAYPGDRSGKSAVEAEDLANVGYLPMYTKGSFDIFNNTQRTLAARALTQDGQVSPDVICLQEVESLIALRVFNELYLENAYPYALLIDSRDLRQIDVGILSNLPITRARSHVDDFVKNGEFKGTPLFSRDCLEVTLEYNGKEITLFVNHFKSRSPRGKNQAEKEADMAKSRRRRNMQATTVARLLAERFTGSDYQRRLFAVLGDLNDTPEDSPLKPLVEDCGLVDGLGGLAPLERWTNYYKSKGSVTQLDHVLLSPALAQLLREVKIERRGIGFRAISKKDPSKVLPENAKFEHHENDKKPELLDFQFERFDGVSAENGASDHCPIFLRFDL